MLNHPIIQAVKFAMKKTKKCRSIARTAKQAYMLGLMLGHAGPSSKIGIGAYCLLWIIVSSVLSIILHLTGDAI